MEKYLRIFSANFEIYINQHIGNGIFQGYFENKWHGDDEAGQLWFEDGDLIDFDGTYSLPLEVGEAINNKTLFNVDIEQFCK